MNTFYNRWSLTASCCRWKQRRSVVVCLLWSYTAWIDICQQWKHWNKDLGKGCIVSRPLVDANVMFWELMGIKISPWMQSWIVLLRGGRNSTVCCSAVVGPCGISKRQAHSSLCHQADEQRKGHGDDNGRESRCLWWREGWARLGGSRRTMRCIKSNKYSIRAGRIRQCAGGGTDVSCLWRMIADGRNVRVWWLKGVSALPSSIPTVRGDMTTMVFYCCKNHVVKGVDPQL